LGLTISEALPQLVSGELSSSEWVRRCLERIAAREDAIRAWAYLDPGSAAAQAAARDRARQTAGTAGTPPLLGVPVGVKDVYDTADMPTEYGSPIYRGHRPGADSWVVARLRAAGAVILGKTVTTQFAYFDPGPTRNPVDTSHTPGGSSSGSAAAVADGMVPIAVGTQTAGSVTRPASFCGVAGYVPTHGRLPLTGVSELSPSLDTAGFLAQSTEDLLRLAHVFGLANEAAVVTEGRAQKPPLAVLVWPGSEIDAIEPGMTSAMARASDALSVAGARVTPLRLGAAELTLIDAHCAIMAYEAARTLSRHGSRAADGATSPELSPAITDLILSGRAITEANYLEARSQVAAQRRSFLAALAGFDAIVGPAAPGPAPAGLGSTGAPIFSRPWQALGMPTVTVPAYRNERNLPLGVQVIGIPGEDESLLRAAGQIEAILKADRLASRLEAPALQ
jgi:Asp-tRNA(Asn)/Glu-tRNA(Gln) amidotransferase A subunit family amidase